MFFDNSLQMKTALHIACMQGYTDAALELASHDPSTLDGFDKVSGYSIILTQNSL